MGLIYLSNGASGEDTEKTPKSLEILAQNACFSRAFVVDLLLDTNSQIYGTVRTRQSLPNRHVVQDIVVEQHPQVHMQFKCEFTSPDDALLCDTVDQKAACGKEFWSEAQLPLETVYYMSFSATYKVEGKQIDPEKFRIGRTGSKGTTGSGEGSWAWCSLDQVTPVGAGGGEVGFPEQVGRLWVSAKDVLIAYSIRPLAQDAKSRSIPAPPPARGGVHLR